MASIVNLLAQALTNTGAIKTTAPVRATSNNPYGNNPFVSYNGNAYQNSYAKNAPVRGGYFAGYYNGKQNIVGQRLFVEV